MGGGGLNSFFLVYGPPNVWWGLRGMEDPPNCWDFFTELGGRGEQLFSCIWTTYPIVGAQGNGRPAELLGFLHQIWGGGVSSFFLVYGPPNLWWGLTGMEDVTKF